ncbi:hypothetical protein LTSEADE_2320, partial [Salmonella enterica subsp. enterica serovar Adelaide str. A4-669]
MDYARHEENRMKQQTNRNRRWVLASRPHGAYLTGNEHR